jgi:hypothetical protein
MYRTSNSNPVREQIDTSIMKNGKSIPLAAA